MKTSTPRLTLFLMTTALSAALLSGCGAAQSETSSSQPAAAVASPSTVNSSAFDVEAATKALTEAVRNNDVEAARRAIADGADMEVEVARGMTPVVAATKAENAELAIALIKAGADVNAKDDIEDSAFLYAGAEGYNEILKATIAAGAQVDSVNRYGGTALIPASEHGHVETIKILIDAGVPLDHINNPGWTAIHEAIVLNNGGPRQVEAIRLLLEAGADPSIPDSNGTSPRDLASQRGFTDIVDLLEKYV